MSDKTGRIDCQCGDQIISNSGKVMSNAFGLISCWDPKCGIFYDYATLEKLRVDNKVVVFDPPGKDLKIFKMNDCDWWMDKTLDEAKKNFLEFCCVDADEALENPCELTSEQMDNHEFCPDENYKKSYPFKHELQRRQSISSKPEFFASTEF